MTSVRTLALRTQRDMRGGSRPTINRLQADIGDTDTDLVLGFPFQGHVDRGSIIAIDLELMWVWEVDANSNMLTVERGYGGSTPVAHVVGTMVELNERWPLPDVVQHMRDEIASWPAVLYRPESRSYDVASGSDTITLDPEWLGCYGVLSARREPSGDSTYDTSWPELQFMRLVKDMPGNAFYSQVYLRIPPQPYNGRVNVTVALPFDTPTWTLTTELEPTIGLTGGMLDIIRLGVMRRCYPGVEIASTARRTQGESRDPQELPPGSALRGMPMVQQQYDRYLRDETMRLMAQYPVRW